MRLRSGFASSVGLVRQSNEDSYLVRAGLYAVCDGMGGARAGEVASEMACRGLLDVDPAKADGEVLLRAVRDANREIAARSAEEDRLRGMGTTLTAALAGDGSLTLIHVGDSRAYLFHDGRLSQLTNDHSWVAEMMRRGELTPNEAAVHPHRSVITKALGTDHDVDPDVFETPFEIGDRLLICSDGLSGMVDDSEMARILSRGEDAQSTAAMLIQAALVGGGEDNVTAVVVDALSDGEEDDSGDSPDGGGEEPMLGPVDRGTPSTHRNRVMPFKGRHSASGGRGILGKKVGPSLRPVSETDGDAALTGATFAGETGSDADLLSSEGEGGPGPAGAAPGAAPGAQEGERARGWTRRKWIVLAVVVAIVVIVAVGGFAAINSTVYYVGASDGVVALYKGLPATVIGISLSGVVETGTVPYDSLAPYVKSRVDAHDLVSKEEGQMFLRSLSAAQ